MNITKFTQSCLKIEHNGRAIMVDIGTLATADYQLGDFGEFEAVIFTHSHSDHLDTAILPDIAAKDILIYGNADVAQHAGDTKIEVIEDGEELVIADFKVKTFHMEHCKMVDGSAGVPNTGFLINDQLLLPGDSTEDVGISADILAVPIFGPDISLHDAFTLAKATGARHLVPVHYDVAEMTPAIFGRLGAKALSYANIHALKNGESVEISDS